MPMPSDYTPPSNTEPARNISTVAALTAAVLNCLVLFGLPLNNEQTAAILLVVNLAAPIVAGQLIRRKVTPV